MLLKINTHKKVVGTKQVKRALLNKQAKVVYIAKDADKKIIKEIKGLCDNSCINMIYVDSMKKLGKICRIDVSAATAALLK